MDLQPDSIQQKQEFLKSLPILDPTIPHTFIKPVKRIQEGHDVPHFLTSRAYGDIGKFIMQLNISMCPRKTSGTEQAQTWQLDTPLALPEPVRRIQEMLQSIGAIIEEAPPDTGPRRFGNVSFRKWYEILESRAEDLLKTHLPQDLLHYNSEGDTSVLDELTPYLLGGFGSSQRLDYGTGHELSFIAFLGCIWKLGGFTKTDQQDGLLERSIVLGIIEPYLRVVRRLILTYTLEPAGSHGVWGLDDHSFVPYILGSSQYCPAISDDQPMPIEGALPGSPKPGDIVKKNVVDRERAHNMYFSAIGFINDVKTGPFWEHSPILFDISGIRSGWGKINKGMMKMYNAEVLAKFPVVQHFPFGSVFSWDQDPNATSSAPSVHTASQPSARSTASNSSTLPPQDGTRAPWAHQAPSQPGAPPNPTSMPPTRAPWADRGQPVESNAQSMAGTGTGTVLPWRNADTGATRAPWSDQRKH